MLKEWFYTYAILTTARLPAARITSPQQTTIVPYIASLPSKDITGARQQLKHQLCHLTLVGYHQAPYIP